MNALKILIIEDDLILAEELAEQLVDLGYSITAIASNSEAATRAFRRMIPDLVLCDIHLQGSTQDGIEVAKTLHTIARVPLIFLTAFGDEATVERAKAAQPAYYLVKPCTPLQLEVALDFALDNFTSQKEAHIEQSFEVEQSPRQAIHSEANCFYIKERSYYQRVDIAAILWVEAMGAQVKIVTDSGTYVFTSNLGSFEQKVAHPHLFRVHRSYMLHLQKVQSFDNGRAFISYQQGKQEIPISKSYRTAFFEKLPRLLSD